MIVTIDVGNTAISVGFFRHRRLLSSYSVPTENFLKSTAYLFSSKNISKRKVFSNPFSSCIMCSVVPSLNKKIKQEVKRRLKCNTYIVGENIKLPIRHRYKKITALGTDRLVNIFGGLRLYKPPFIIIDFGTAVTFDYVDKKGIFRGGLIVPGLMTSFTALCEKASLLPKNLRLRKPKAFLGHISKECMINGAVYGFASLTDGLISMFRKRYGRTVKVVLTGGSAAFIKPFLRSKIHLKPELTLNALNLILLDRV